MNWDRKRPLCLSGCRRGSRSHSLWPGRWRRPQLCWGRRELCRRAKSRPSLTRGMPPRSPGDPPGSCRHQSRSGSWPRASPRRHSRRCRCQECWPGIAPAQCKARAGWGWRRAFLPPPLRRKWPRFLPSAHWRVPACLNRSFRGTVPTAGIPRLTRGFCRPLPARGRWCNRGCR